MKRFLLLFLLTPAALGATYNVALPGGGVLTVNGLPYVNPGITNSASVVWGVDGTGLLYATSTGTNSSIVYVDGTAITNLLSSASITNTVASGQSMLSVRDSGVAAGTYSNLVAAIGADGRITSASSATNLVLSTLSAGTLTATSVSGDGSGLTNLNGSNIASGTVSAARIDSAIARLASPALTGTPTAPTASALSSNTTIANTKYVDDAVKAKTSTAILSLAHTASQNPADLGTNQIGGDFGRGSTTATHLNVAVPAGISGTIVGYRVTTFVTGTLGTTESVTNYVNVGGSLYGQALSTYASARNVATATGLSQAVAATDTVTIEVQFPSWATNPTSCRWVAYVYIQQ